MIARLLRLLPRGTVAVGSGLVVLGAASYVHLAVAGHALSASAYSSLSVLWSIVFSIGPGLFFPLEQEITRLVAARQVSGDGAGPVFRRGFAVALGLLVVLWAALAAGTPTIADRLFDGDRGMVAVLAGALAGLALAHPTRGVLAGSGRFGGYGVQLAIDGGLRIVFAAALGLAGVHTAVPYGLILVVAPVLSVLATAAPVRAALRAGTALAWSALARGVGPLVVSMLLAQLVVNVAVVDVKLLAPRDAALAGALLSALVLARVPVFAFASLQAALLPGLAGLAASGDRAGFRRLVLRGCGLVVALSAAVGVPAVFLGAWLVRTLFAAAPVLGDLDFALLAAGTGAYLLAQVLGQGVLALGFHRDQAAAWLGGSAVLVLVTVLPGDVKLRVEGAYAVGSLVVAGLLAAALVRRARHPGTVPPGDVTPAPAVLLGGVD
ncbi:MAG TPA: polysaccharide biosynthesis protein [Rugosimonospora sp.]|nr:polysaccharide biosynthesis protein [Rugosimonospora sp.]